MDRHPCAARLSRRTVLGVACAIAASVAGPAAHAQAEPDLDVAVRLVVEQSNAFRRGERLAPLRVDAVLGAVAQGFADYMASTDRYGHEADGRSPAQRVEARGYAYCRVAENIAFLVSSAGFATDELASGFVDGWKTSPPHRRNLLDADVSEIGVGIAHGRKSRRYYAVQVFGRPRADAFRVAVANGTPGNASYRFGGETFGLAPRVTRTHQVCSATRLAVGADPDGIRVDADARFTVEADPAGVPRLRRD